MLQEKLINPFDSRNKRNALISISRRNVGGGWGWGDEERFLRFTGRWINKVGVIGADKLRFNYHNKTRNLIINFKTFFIVVYAVYYLSRRSASRTRCGGGFLFIFVCVSTTLCFVPWFLFQFFVHRCVATINGFVSHQLHLFLLPFSNFFGT